MTLAERLRASARRLLQFRMTVEVAASRMEWEPDWPLDRSCVEAADALESAAAIVEAAERSGKRLRDMAHGLETDWIATDVEPTLDTRIGDAIDLMHSVDNDLSAALAAAGRPHAD